MIDGREGEGKRARGEGRELHHLVDDETFRRVEEGCVLESNILHFVIKATATCH